MMFLVSKILLGYEEAIWAKKLEMIHVSQILVLFTYLIATVKIRYFEKTKMFERIFNNFCGLLRISQLYRINCIYNTPIIIARYFSFQVGLILLNIMSVLEIIFFLVKNHLLQKTFATKDQYWFSAKQKHFFLKLHCPIMNKIFDKVLP